MEPRASPAIPGWGLAILPGLLVMLLPWALLEPWTAHAHTRSISYSSWELDENGAEVTLRVPLLELSRLGPGALPQAAESHGEEAGVPDLASRAFPRELVMWADGDLCRAPARASRHPDESGWVRYRWRIDCPPEAGTLAIRSRLLLDVAPSHMHFARVRFADPSGSVREQMLTEAASELVLRRPDGDTAPTHAGSGLTDYLWLGVEHIVTGWDHLAFVLGLLLLARRLGEVARLVTGFTLAHSLTLALAVLDRVEPHSAAVEAVIAFSVALVAIEKLWLQADRDRLVPLGVLVGLGVLTSVAALAGASLPTVSLLGLLLFTACYFALVSRNDSGWLRVCLTFAFGLVHGFGFAGVLTEMALPAERLVPALLGFNLGVEIGQIAIVLILWPVLQIGARVAPRIAAQWATELVAAGLAGLGIYWLVERTFTG